MSRVGKKPIAAVKGVDIKVAVWPGHRERPEGRAEDGSVRRSLRQGRERRSQHRGAATRTSASRKRMWGTARANIQNMVIGVTTGFTKDLELSRRRLPRRDEGQGSRAVARLLAPGRLQGAGRHHLRVRQADRDQDLRRRQADRSVRSPPKSAAAVRPSPTKARACARWANTSAARKARRSKRSCKLTQKTGIRRAQRVRTKLRKVADGKARLSVTRSTKHISVQLIDDAKGVTVAAASSLEKDFKGGTKSEDASSGGQAHR